MSNILHMASSENTAGHEGTRFQTDVVRQKHIKHIGKVKQFVIELFQTLCLIVFLNSASKRDILFLAVLTIVTNLK